MPRTSLFALLLAVAALLAPSSTASASTRAWYDRCAVSGAFRACASVQITTTQDLGTGRTQVVIRVRNLQGTPGISASPNMSFYAFTAWSRSPIRNLSSPGPNGHGIARVGLEEGATEVVPRGVNSDYFWEEDGTETSIWLRDVINKRPILGCDYDPLTWVPPGESGGPGYSTCGGGWVSLSFTTNVLWDVADLTDVSFIFQGPNSGGGGYASCAAEGTRGNGTTEVSCEVVPEPMTVVLLGTGLFGVGAARLRRRKKDSSSDA